MIRRLVLLTLVLGACTSGVPLRDIAAPRSGVTFTSNDIRQLQNDDAANPGMLWSNRARRSGARQQRVTDRTTSRARVATVTRNNRCVALRRGIQYTTQPPATC